MKQVVFASKAREEFVLEVQYYESERRGLGARFAQAVEEAVARAIAFPETGSRTTKNTRRVFVRDFPFAIVYRSDSNGIVVFAVAHHRRKPDYWRSRIQEA